MTVLHSEGFSTSRPGEVPGTTISSASDSPRYISMACSRVTSSSSPTITNVRLLRPAHSPGATRRNETRRRPRDQGAGQVRTKQRDQQGDGGTVAAADEVRRAADHGL